MERCYNCFRVLADGEVGVCQRCKDGKNPYMLDGCNRCQNVAFKDVDNEPLCRDCALGELIDVVERLSTAWVSVTAEVRYED